MFGGCKQICPTKLGIRNPHRRIVWRRYWCATLATRHPKTVDPQSSTSTQRFIDVVSICRSLHTAGALPGSQNCLCLCPAQMLTEQHTERWTAGRDQNGARVERWQGIARMERGQGTLLLPRRLVLTGLIGDSAMLTKLKPSGRSSVFGRLIAFCTSHVDAALTKKQLHK